MNLYYVVKYSSVYGLVDTLAKEKHVVATVTPLTEYHHGMYEADINAKPLNKI